MMKAEIRGPSLGAPPPVMHQTVPLAIAPGQEGYHCKVLDTLVHLVHESYSRHLSTQTSDVLVVVLCKQAVLSCCHGELFCDRKTAARY